MRNKLLIWSFITLLLAAGIFFLCRKSPVTSTGAGEVVFMDSFQVFEEFTMKQEYDKLLEKEVSAERSRLDSLANSLQLMVSDKTATEVQINADKTAYFRYKENYEKAFGALSEKYTSQVYERLNDYIKDFGKQKHYRLILGASGQGNVMYVDKGADITAELITFINQKYLDN